jgi:putative Mn2+ efflux pump MntP
MVNDNDDDINRPHESTNSSDSSSDENKKKISTSSYYKFSTLLAIIITFPGIVVLFVLRHLDIDILYQIIFSSIAFFICIGLSFKISSKLTKFYKN